jgi:hypothetical protein
MPNDSSSTDSTNGQPQTVVSETSLQRITEQSFSLGRKVLGHFVKPKEDRKKVELEELRRHYQALTSLASRYFVIDNTDGLPGSVRTLLNNFNKILSHEHAFLPSDYHQLIGALASVEREKENYLIKAETRRLEMLVSERLSGLMEGRDNGDLELLLTTFDRIHEKIEKALKESYREANNLGENPYSRNAEERQEGIFSSKITNQFGFETQISLLKIYKDLLIASTEQTKAEIASLTEAVAEKYVTGDLDSSYGDCLSMQDRFDQLNSRIENIIGSVNGDPKIWGPYPYSETAKKQCAGIFSDDFITQFGRKMQINLRQVFKHLREAQVRQAKSWTITLANECCQKSSGGIFVGSMKKLSSLQNEFNKLNSLIGGLVKSTTGDSGKWGDTPYSETSKRASTGIYQIAEELGSQPVGLLENINVYFYSPISLDQFMAPKRIEELLTEMQELRSAREIQRVGVLKRLRNVDVIDLTTEQSQKRTKTAGEILESFQQGQQSQQRRQNQAESFEVPNYRADVLQVSKDAPSLLERAVPNNVRRKC